MKITKTGFYLFLIFIFALILRIIVANNFDLNPDEMAYGLHPLNIISAGRLSTIHQSTLHAYSTDVVYQLFGFGTFTSRLIPVFFGSLAVILIFLIAKEIFNSDKAGLMAAFLSAVSGYNVINNLEPDIAAFFFLLFSILFFVKFVKSNKNKYIYISTIALGFSVLFKIIVIPIIFAYFLFYLIYTKKHTEIKIFNKNIFKMGITCLILLIFTFMPVLTYNYLSYKESGVTDEYFSTHLGIGKNMEIGMGGQKPWTFSRLITISKIKLFDQFIKMDPFVLLFGLLGLIFMFKKKNEWGLFFSFLILSLWIYLTGRTGSDTHYVIFLMLLSMPAAETILFLCEKIKHNFKSIIKVFIVVVLIVSLISLDKVLFNRPAGALELRKYAFTIPDEAIIIIDPLIYTGNAIWAFGDKHYLVGSHFPDLIQQIGQIPEPKTKVPLYYVECGGTRYCGWKPEDQQRVFNFSEELTGYFKGVLTFLTEIKGSDDYRFPIYRGEIEIIPSVYEVIDRTHWFYLYPLGWKYTENVMDNYTPKTFFDKIINNLAFMILYLEVFLVILSPVIVIYLFTKRKK